MRISLNQKPNSSRDFGFQAAWDSTGARVTSIQPGKDVGEKQPSKQRDLCRAGRALFNVMCADVGWHLTKPEFSQITVQRLYWKQALWQVFTVRPGWLVVSRFLSPLQWWCQTYVGQLLCGSDLQGLGLSLSFYWDSPPAHPSLFHFSNAHITMHNPNLKWVIAYCLSLLLVPLFIWITLNHTLSGLPALKYQ